MSENITNNPSVPSQVVAEVKFPRFINNLGIIPTSYKDSMSYYETLAWLCKYLEETVIPTVNQNGQAVQELQALYIQLNDYVTHYFDNLDVQEEINNKLDEMADDGTLQEIIGAYLDANALWCFDTVNDMINAENLINGSYAKTLGFYSKNDGGMATYKIRTITNDDVVDDISLIAMENDNSLIAELIFEDNINVLQLGVQKDVQTSCSVNIRKAIELAKGKSLYFPEGKYYITEPIKNYPSSANFTNLYFDSHAEIIPLSTVDYILDLGGIDETFDYEVGNKKFVSGGIMQGYENVNIAIIKIEQKIKDLQLEKMQIYSNCDGIICGDNNTSSQDLIIKDIILHHKQQLNTHKGIIFNSNDNRLQNSKLYFDEIEIVLNGGTLTIDNIQTLANNTNTKSIGIQVNSTPLFISNSYFDSQDVAIQNNHNGSYILMNNINYYSYRENVMTAFELTDYCRLGLTNFRMFCKNIGSQHKGIVAPYSIAQIMLTQNYLKTNGVVIEQAEFMRDGDILKGCTSSDYSNCASYQPQTSNSQNTWYYIGAYPCHNNIENRLVFECSNRHTSTTIVVKCGAGGSINADNSTNTVISEDNATYVAGYKLLNPGFDDDVDYPRIALYLKRTSANARLIQNVELEGYYKIQMSNSANRPTTALQSATVTPDLQYEINCANKTITPIT